MTDERLAELMVKVADGLATPAERAELDAHLADHPALEKELQMHKKLNAITDGWVHRLEQDLRDDTTRKRMLPRLWLGTGVTLLLLAAAVVMGGVGVELFLDPEAPWWLKAGVGSGMAGAVMLLAGIGGHRLANYKNDPYTEVIR